MWSMGVVLGLLKFGQSVVNEGLALGTSRVPRRGVAVDLRGSWLRESRLPPLKTHIRKSHKLVNNVSKSPGLSMLNFYQPRSGMVMQNCGPKKKLSYFCFFGCCCFCVWLFPIISTKSINLKKIYIISIKL